MIVEDERDDNEVVDLDYEQIDGVDNPPIQVSQEQSDGFMTYIQSYECIRDQEIQSQLQSNLIEYLWQLQLARRVKELFFNMLRSLSH